LRQQLDARTKAFQVINQSDGKNDHRSGEYKAEVDRFKKFLTKSEKREFWCKKKYGVECDEDSNPAQSGRRCLMNFTVAREIKEFVLYRKISDNRSDND
jgi:hypothetical protein